VTSKRKRTSNSEKKQHFIANVSYKDFSVEVQRKWNKSIWISISTIILSNVI